MSQNDQIKSSNAAKIAGINALIKSHDKSISFHIYFGVVMFLLGLLLFALSTFFIPEEGKLIAQSGSGFVAILCAIPVNKINTRRGQKGVLKFLLHLITTDPVGFSEDEHAQNLLKKYLEKTLLGS